MTSPVTPGFSILFVCMGNICRSPTAHGVLRHRLGALGLGSRVRVDSAGTHDFHPGKAPDERSQTHALRRGYDLSDLRARQIRLEDFVRHDLILAMDQDNLDLVLGQCPPAQAHKVRLFTSFCLRQAVPSVPDPYYGQAEAFERVLDLVEDACDGLLQHVQTRLA